jgi:hypothetical protein
MADFQYTATTVSEEAEALLLRSVAKYCATTSNVPLKRKKSGSR